MESLLGPLLPLFGRERDAGRPLALGLLVHTEGSTYRKPGALMLIAADGHYAGLLSGGCLEADLRQHAMEVIDTGRPKMVRYDMRSGDDLIWGLGLGCEGAMHILLLRVGPVETWQPLAYLAQCLHDRRAAAIGIVTESEQADVPAGTLILARNAARTSGAAVTHVGPWDILDSPDVETVLDQAAKTGRAGWVESVRPRWTLFALPVCLPPRILLLGAGPDAAPVVTLASQLNWKVTLVDHRPAYADPAHFPAAESVLLTRAEELLTSVDPQHFSAAVVMSHHLPSDLEYLRSLARTNIPYVGLLGPAARRERLLADLGPQAGTLLARLHAPVGLPIGGRTPESIALAIVAEIHAFVHNNSERPHVTDSRAPEVEGGGDVAEGRRSPAARA